MIRILWSVIWLKFKGNALEETDMLKETQPVRRRELLTLSELTEELGLIEVDIKVFEAIEGMNSEQKWLG